MALNLAVEYIDPYKYLQENGGLVREMIESTLVTVTTGKYVLNFFESILRQAKTK
jgi:hypothetical protein